MVNQMTWTEKYRPRYLKDIIGNTPIINALVELARRAKSGNWEIPHLLFHGGPGLGKTTAAHAFARELFGEDAQGRANNISEFNASDERGIDTIRTKVVGLLKTVPLSFDKKIVFLSEMDRLTPDAQAALRRPMEKYAEKNIIILDCNDVTSLHPALISRCLFQNTRFRAVDKEPMVNLLGDIATKEGLSVESLDLIVDHSNGSVRDAINLLYEVSLSGDVTRENVAKLLTKPINQSSLQLFQLIKAGDLRKIRREVDGAFFGKGIPGREIIKGLHDLIVKEPIDRPTKFKCIGILADGLEMSFKYDDYWGAVLATERMAGGF